LSRYDEHRLMRRALDGARRGWGRVHPNPMVGALVVRDDVVLGEGCHAEFGGPHAEVAALAAAGADAAGATLLVTLEPCAHHGKTPPCTDAIIAAGIRRVVYAAPDPDLQAAGGADVLRRAGVETTGGVEATAARTLNAAFFHVHQHRSTFVALKLAASLDAKLSRLPGVPTQVSGAAAQAEVHRLRAGFDALLIGVGTALADDPLLTVRGDIEPRVPPIRLIADSTLRLPPSARLLADASTIPVWILTSEHAPDDRERALVAAGARVIRLPTDDGRVATGPLLDRLWAEGVRTVLCEGGGALGAALLAADRVARLILFVAPALFGARGVPAFPVASGGPWAAADGWRLVHAGAVGRDALAVWDRAF
jgi:diaminohydroxyphosphoribosylaminopyrimidine deaminase / 5-amino-6-(5-phosphoribosylamino)uracil reductase